MRRTALLSAIAVAATAVWAAVDDVVSVGEIPALTVRAGETVSVEIPLAIAAGHHIQANPASNEFLIPLTFTVAGAADTLVAGVTYPPAGAYRLEGTDEDLLTYEGMITVLVDVTVPVDAAVGMVTVEGVLDYQGCTERSCLIPASSPVAFVVEVVAPDGAESR